MGHGVLVREVLEQRRQGGNLGPDGCGGLWRFFLGNELVTLLDDVRPGYDPELLGPPNLLTPGKLEHVVPIGAAGLGVLDLRQPFGLRRHVRELVELRRGQVARPAWGQGGVFWVCHIGSFHA